MHGGWRPAYVTLSSRRWNGGHMNWHVCYMRIVLVPDSCVSKGGFYPASEWFTKIDGCAQPFFSTFFSTECLFFLFLYIPASPFLPATCHLPDTYLLPTYHLLCCFFPDSSYITKESVPIVDRSIKIFNLEVDTNINMCTDRLKTKDLSEKCKSRGSGACRRYHTLSRVPEVALLLVPGRFNFVRS